MLCNSELHQLTQCELLLVQRVVVGQSEGILDRVPVPLLELVVLERRHDRHRFFELEYHILKLLHGRGALRHLLLALDAGLVVLLGLFGDILGVNVVEDGSLPGVGLLFPLHKSVPEANSGLCRDLSVVDLPELVLRHFKRSLVVQLLLFAVN